MTYTKEEYSKKALENEQFATNLPGTIPGIEWAITAQFYAALHYVNAYFATKGEHYSGHPTRIRAIQKDSWLSVIYDDYQGLYNISRDARYECMNLGNEELLFAQKKLHLIKSVICRYL